MADGSTHKWRPLDIDPAPWYTRAPPNLCGARVDALQRPPRMASSLVQGGAIATLLDHRAGGAVSVDIDFTFLAQVVLFFLLFFLLKPILFDPMLRLFEERERRIDGAKTEAREMFSAADAKIALYEEQLTQVKRQAGEERDKLRAEGQRREQAILAKVRAETNARLEEGKAKIAKEGDALRAELAVTSQTLAREIASRVLGREV